MEPLSDASNAARLRQPDKAAGRLVICASGFHGAAKLQLQAQAAALGASYSGNLVAGRTTHLVCRRLIDAFGSAKYRMALEWGVHVVSHKWLLDSVAAGRWLPAEGYKDDGEDALAASPPPPLLLARAGMAGSAAPPRGAQQAQGVQAVDKRQQRGKQHHAATAPALAADQQAPMREGSSSGSSMGVSALSGAIEVSSASQDASEEASQSLWPAAGQRARGGQQLGGSQGADVEVPDSQPWDNQAHGNHALESQRCGQAASQHAGSLPELGSLRLCGSQPGSLPTSPLGGQGSPGGAAVTAFSFAAAGADAAKPAAPAAGSPRWGWQASQRRRGSITMELEGGCAAEQGAAAKAGGAGRDGRQPAAAAAAAVLPAEQAPIPETQADPFDWAAPSSNPALLRYPLLGRGGGGGGHQSAQAAMPAAGPDTAGKESVLPAARGRAAGRRVAQLQETPASDLQQEGDTASDAAAAAADVREAASEALEDSDLGEDELQQLQQAAAAAARKPLHVQERRRLRHWVAKAGAASPPQGAQAATPLISPLPHASAAGPTGTLPPASRTTAGAPHSVCASSAPSDAAAGAADSGLPCARLFATDGESLSCGGRRVPSGVAGGLRPLGGARPLSGASVTTGPALTAARAAGSSYAGGGGAAASTARQQQPHQRQRGPVAEADQDEWAGEDPTEEVGEAIDSDSSEGGDFVSAASRGGTKGDTPAAASAPQRPQSGAQLSFVTTRGPVRARGAASHATAGGGGSGGGGQDSDSLAAAAEAAAAAAGAEGEQSEGWWGPAASASAVTGATASTCAPPPALVTVAADDLLSSDGSPLSCAAGPGGGDAAAMTGRSRGGSNAFEEALQRAVHEAALQHGQAPAGRMGTRGTPAPATTAATPAHSRIGGASAGKGGITELPTVGLARGDEALRRQLGARLAHLGLGSEEGERPLALKLLSRGARGSSARQWHGLPPGAGGRFKLQYAEQIQIPWARATFSTKERAHCAIVVAPASLLPGVVAAPPAPGGAVAGGIQRPATSSGGGGGATSEGSSQEEEPAVTFVAEPAAFYQLPSGGWWLECHRFLSARDLRAVAKAKRGGGAAAAAAPVQLRLPVDYSADEELLRSTAVLHVPVEFIKGSIKLARVRRAAQKARGSFWWRYDFVEATLTVVPPASGRGGAAEAGAHGGEEVEGGATQAPQ